MIEYTDKNALLLLNMVEGLGLKRRHRLLEAVPSPACLINGDENYRADIITVIGRDLYEKLQRLTENNAASEELDRLYKADIKVVTYLDGEYPEQLKEIYEFPTVLYCRGNISLLKTRSISVVGTRNPSRYGINVTRDFVSEFCRAGLTVVSGFARGIDSAAHKAAVELEAPTTAVIASGADICYPAENRALKDRILDTDGLIVSEYRLGTAPAQFNFPERNRIISGLSEALFVPEMKIKSGTMLTVNHALEQGKNLFVVPSNINSPTGEGSNRLILTMQGCVALAPSDVLDKYGIDLDKKEKESYQLSLVEQQIIAALEKGTAHFEDLIEITGLTVNGLQTVVLEMEMNDLIEKETGNFYILK